MIRAVDEQTFRDRLAETLESIANDAAAGKLRRGPEVHPVMRVWTPIDDEGGMEPADVASLLAARLMMQGYLLFFDEAAARRNLDAALARAGEKLAEHEGQA